MHATSISSVTPFISHNTDRLASATATSRAAATQRRAVADRMFTVVSSVIIVTLLNLACVAWVCPIANQLAEWAGVSLLNSTIVGLVAMLASVPVAVVATILICARRRKNRRNKTNSPELSAS